MEATGSRVVDDDRFMWEGLLARHIGGKLEGGRVTWRSDLPFHVPEARFALERTAGFAWPASDGSAVAGEVDGGRHALPIVHPYSAGQQLFEETGGMRRNIQGSTRQSRRFPGETGGGEPRSGEDQQDESAYCHRPWVDLSRSSPLIGISEAASVLDFATFPPVCGSSAAEPVAARAA